MAKPLISSPILNALAIGFLIGILGYSIWFNTWGLLSIIPLFFLYKLLQKKKPDS